MRLVRANTHYRHQTVAAQVVWWCWRITTAVAARANEFVNVNLTVHVTFRSNELLALRNDATVAFIAAIQLGVIARQHREAGYEWRRERVTSAARFSLRLLLRPHRGCRLMTIGVRTLVRAGRIRWVSMLNHRKPAKQHVCRPFRVNVTRTVPGCRHAMTDITCDCGMSLGCFQVALVSTHTRH
jgi:hypothetical protein